MTNAAAFLGLTEDADPRDKPPTDEQMFNGELLDDLKTVLRQHYNQTPRHLQRSLGPSEVGHACSRKIAAGLLGLERLNPEGDPLPSWMGTAAHSRMELAIELDNERALKAGKPPRWFSERRVKVREGLEGTADLYDRETGTVIDLKGLALNTPIPTPAGWSTMGSLSVGDRVFDANGGVCNVVAVTPPTERCCYRITFDDDAEVICDHVHEWVVQYGQDSRSRTMTAPQMAAKLRDPKGQLQIRVANAGALSLPHADLPVEPYLLGAWLGDGDSDSGRISKPEPELFANIAEDGHDVGDWQVIGGKPVRRRIHGLTQTLRFANILNNKHIPAEYFRASHTQRLALLRGLMDTDGTWNRKRNQAVFTTTDKRLAGDVMELVSSLGWKPRRWEHRATGFGVTTTAYPVTFVPFGDNPFRVTRKAELVRLAGTTRAKRRIIKQVEQIPTVPTRCITVDSPTSTFLCTRMMIPTHNCPGVTKCREYRKHGPIPEYRTQGHMYGRGYRNEGFPVERVAIWFIPRGGFLSDSFIWSEAYSDQIVDDTLARLDNITVLLNDLDIEQHPERLAIIPATPSNCEYCPIFVAGVGRSAPYGCRGAAQ